MSETESRGIGGGGADDGVEYTSAAGVPEHTATGARHLILPEMFDGTGNWSDWRFHFGGCKRLGQCTKTEMAESTLDWTSQEALHHLLEATAATYRDAHKARIHVRLGTKRSFKRGIKRPQRAGPTLQTT